MSNTKLMNIQVHNMLTPQPRPNLQKDTDNLSDQDSCTNDMGFVTFFPGQKEVQQEVVQETSKWPKHQHKHSKLPIIKKEQIQGAKDFSDNTLNNKMRETFSGVKTSPQQRFS